MIKRNLFRFLYLFLAILAAYGLGRLYFHLTAGFTLNNIASDFAYNPEWEIRPLSVEEKTEVEVAVNQPYYYLGKGCQSYAFLSEDKKYVIKFFKYQRYRLQSWLEYFPSLPAIVKYRKEKLEKKWNKLDGFVKSWKTAFEHLKEETGLVVVHLNKSKDLNKTLTIYDKLGHPYNIDLDQMEYCVQKRADMLCDSILSYKKNGEFDKSKNLINRLLALILSEYARGLADNDHALMQNTGVVDDFPVHIDVGQFVFNENVKNPEIYHQELFTKTYKFKIWLKEHDPILATFLDSRLEEIMGEKYATMKPKFRVK